MKEESLINFNKIKEENEKLKAENECFKDCADTLIELQRKYSSLLKEIEQLYQSKLYSTKEWNDLRDENAQLKAQLQNVDEAELLIKFRLGDRVAVHREGRAAFRGTIFNITQGKLHVIEDGFYSAHDDSPFLASQCRKLKKVKKSMPHKCPTCFGLTFASINNPTLGQFLNASYEHCRFYPYGLIYETCRTCNGTGVVGESK